MFPASFNLQNKRGSFAPIKVYWHYGESSDLLNDAYLILQVLQLLNKVHRISFILHNSMLPEIIKSEE